MSLGRDYYNCQGKNIISSTKYKYILPKIEFEKELLETLCSTWKNKKENKIIFRTVYIFLHKLPILRMC